MSEKTLRETLWKNVEALMNNRWGKVNITRLREAAGIGASAVSDIKEKRRSVGLDVVEKIAEVFGDVQPWQLLHPEGGVPPKAQLPGDVQDLVDELMRLPEGEREDAVYRAGQGAFHMEPPKKRQQAAQTTPEQATAPVRQK